MSTNRRNKLDFYLNQEDMRHCKECDEDYLIAKEGGHDDFCPECVRARMSEMREED